MKRIESIDIAVGFQSEANIFIKKMNEVENKISTQDKTNLFFFKKLGELQFQINSLNELKEKMVLKEIEWDEDLIIKFTLFHSGRMRDAYQSDNEFYVKQSIELFIEKNVNSDGDNKLLNVKDGGVQK